MPADYSSVVSILVTFLKAIEVVNKACSVVINTFSVDGSLTRDPMLYYCDHPK